MGDILEPLKSFQLNYLSLMRLIPIRDICIEILKQKKTVEEIETYNYHYDMWETHAGKYYECLDKDRTDRRERFIYSFILNDKKIVAERDQVARAYYENNPKAVVQSVSIKDAVDDKPVVEQSASIVKPKKTKVKKTKEVELPNGDIEIQEIEE